jgi:dihydrodiol dehydrogenase / D-xylose 1-dehydrogenase (NADP)
MATRWAICGAGKISQDFCLALSSLPKTEHQIVAVAARGKESAKSFADKFDIPQSFGSYEELASLPDVDVVYIGTIHINHVENSLLYINAGKSVLCEKPMSMSLEGCQKVLAAAKEKGVLFVEAIWSRFFPVYKFIQEHIKAGELGDVIMVESSFAVNIISVPRLNDPELGGGGLLDLGVYVVQAANLIFKGRPDQIIAEGSKTDSGVDKTAVIILKYPGNKFASLKYSIETAAGANSLTIRGTKGNIVIPDCFWCPNRVILQDNSVKYFELPKVDNEKSFTFLHSQGLVYEANGVRDCLLEGLKESPLISHDDIETIHYIMQEVLNQLGVTYRFP